MRVWGFPSQGEAQYRRHLLTRSPKPFRSLKIKPHSITCKTLYGSLFIDQLNNEIQESWSSTNIDDTTVPGLCWSLNQMAWVIFTVKRNNKDNAYPCIHLHPWRSWELTCACVFCVSLRFERVWQGPPVSWDSLSVGCQGQGKVPLWGWGQD